MTHRYIEAQVMTGFTRFGCGGLCSDLALECRPPQRYCFGMDGAFRVIPAVLIMLFWPAVALSEPVGSPTSTELSAALSKPQLDYCDDVACFYRPGRFYEVRAVHCENREAQSTVCTYERVPSGPVIEILTETAASTDTRKWSEATTTLRWFGSGWMVTADSERYVDGLGLRRR
jgi:hypothetical protein